MIEITNKAIENITRLQKEYDSIGWGLRFGLSGGGCSGYKYIIEFEETPDTEDLIYNSGEIKVFLNPIHLDKLKNSIIDWKDSLMESGFHIENPQANRSCGCGKSISF